MNFFFCFPDVLQLSNIPGNEYSAAILSNTFGNLGFKIDYKSNLSASEIEEYIEKTAKDSTFLAEYNCLVVALLSHGSLGKIYGSDGNAISIGKIQATFNSHICPSMHSKPKIFIVDACRIVGGIGFFGFLQVLKNVSFATNSYSAVQSITLFITDVLFFLILKMT